MATNHIFINFDPCEPAPAGGYIVTYRPLGSDIAYRTAGPFLSSPATIADTLDPAGTSYEGFIQGDCGDGKVGVPISWVAQNGDSGSGSGSASGGDSGSAPPEVPCRTYVLTKTVGTPSAHYTDCQGIVRNTLINDHTSICTDGHGFTISGGGITVNSLTDGDCT